jgi:hypothetical protein
MNDTLSVLKGLSNEPVPYVNTGVFLGMTAMDWDLGLKVLLGLASIFWTFLKIYSELKKIRDGKEETNTSTNDK